VRNDLKTWVAKSLRLSKDDPAEAVIWLEQSSDADLQSILRRLGAQQAVRTFYSDQRASAMTMASGRVLASMGTDEMEERTSARIARRAFWESYTLYGHTPIKEATKADLLQSAGMREGQARTEMFLATFERAVAAKLKRDSACVTEVFTSETLEALAAKHKAKHDAE
jgi:hypothetical protein